MLTHFTLTLLLAQSPTTLLVSTGSKHFNLVHVEHHGEMTTTTTWAVNSFNPGASLERRIGSWHVAGGYYYNSSWRHTVYAVAGREKWFADRVSVGVEAGAATGYTRGVIPAGVLFARVGSRALHVKVNVIPFSRPSVGFQVGIRLH